MEIRQLVYFMAIVEEGTISGAAERLHLSQPPLSRQLVRLEEELGCKLFTRDTRHMQLTEAGELLYAGAGEIIRQCDDIKREVGDISEGRGGVLHIGTVSSISGRLLPEWIASFHKIYPKIRLELTEGDSYEITELVRNRKIDIAVVRRPFTETDLEVTSLYEEPMCAVGKRGFFGKRGKKFPIASLAGVPLIIYHRWESILKDEEGLNIICCCDDARTAVSLALAGPGLGIVPLSAVPAPDGENEIRELTDRRLHSEICAVRPKDRYTLMAARLFSDMISGYKLDKE